ncbi:DUF397 domain-containing protein [Streptomyces flavidovirens]|uniref:DUF397 domain-containing protein n=1 Tax=Streptomyces flavidovirens TaxID=67298 RepID=UPI0033BDD6F2
MPTFSPDGSNCLEVVAAETGGIKLRESDEPAAILTATTEELRLLISAYKPTPQPSCNLPALQSAFDAVLHDLDNAIASTAQPGRQSWNVPPGLQGQRTALTFTLNMKRIRPVKKLVWNDSK